MKKPKHILRAEDLYWRIKKYQDKYQRAIERGVKTMKPLTATQIRQMEESHAKIQKYNIELLFKWTGRKK